MIVRHIFAAETIDYEKSYASAFWIENIIIITTNVNGNFVNYKKTKKVKKENGKARLIMPFDGS